MHFLFGMPSSEEGIVGLETWQRHSGCVAGDVDRECQDCAYRWRAYASVADPPPVSMLGALAGALEFAAQAHAEQRDENGAPYVGHLMRVWRGVWAAGGDLDAQAAALLHHSMENQPVTGEGLRALGANESVVAAVQLLTRPDDFNDEDYGAAVAANPLAAIVKEADLADKGEQARPGLFDAREAARRRLKSAKTKRLHAKR